MKCSICKGEIAVTDYGWSEGHNAQPVNAGRCCDTCNWTVVVPMRMSGMFLRRDAQ